MVHSQAALTNTAPRSSAEWNVAVVMPVLGVLGKEVVRVEHLRVLVVLGISVDLVCADNDGGTSRQNVVLSC